MRFLDKKPRLLVLSSVLLSLSAVAHADPVQWIGDGFSEAPFWDEAGNWLRNGANTTPQAGDDVLFTDGETGVTPPEVFYFENPTIATSFNSLLVESQVGNTMTLRHDEGLLQTNSLTVGDTGSGVYAIAEPFGPSNLIVNNDVVLGNQFDSSGQLNVDGGRVDIGGSLRIGNDGTGSVGHTAGSVNVTSDLRLGEDFGGAGSYDLAGSGSSLTTDRTYVGVIGNSSFNQSGGTHSADEVFVGGDSDLFNPGEGTYNLSGGQLTSLFTSVGEFGTGTFTQSDGTHDVGLLILGNVGGFSLNAPIAEGFGTYNLEGGNLNSGNLATGTAGPTTVGGFGQGTFNQTGGTHTVGGAFGVDIDLVVGSGPHTAAIPGLIIDDSVKRRGTYQLSAGDLIVTGNTIIGAPNDRPLPPLRTEAGGQGFFIQSGGSHSVFGDLVVGGAGTTGSGDGHYDMSGGVLSVDGNLFVASTLPLRAGTGEFIQTAGTVNVGQTLGIGKGLAGTSRPNAYRLRGGRVNAGNVVVGLGDAERAVLEVSNNAILSASTLEVRQGGVLQGNRGVVSARTVVRGGLLAPGNSIGQMRIDGDLEVSDGGVLEFEIGGLLPGEIDFLDVTGDVSFIDAVFEIVFINGFFPVVGDVFDIFSFAGNLLSNNVQFAFIGADNFEFDTSFGPSGLSIVTNARTASSIPEPATLILFGVGLAGLTIMRRRKAA